MDKQVETYKEILPGFLLKVTGDKFLEQAPKVMFLEKLHGYLMEKVPPSDNGWDCEAIIEENIEKLKPQFTNSVSVVFVRPYGGVSTIEFVITNKKVGSEIDASNLWDSVQFIIKINNSYSNGFWDIKHLNETIKTALSEVYDSIKKEGKVFEIPKPPECSNDIN